MNEETKERVDALQREVCDLTSYKRRLAAVEELAKIDCKQSKDILWRVMLRDKVHAVQHKAFLALQAFKENVRLPRKPKGHLIPEINKKLGKVAASLDEGFSQDEFNSKFRAMYPEAFDVYQFEKGAKFDQWVQNILNSLPKK